MNLRDLNVVLNPLRARVANMLARAVVKLVDDSGGRQTLQLEVLDGEVRDGIERFQEYGFTSIPKESAEALVLFLGGRREHGVAVAVEDRAIRPTDLEPGEVALYTGEGLRLHLKAAGTIHLGTSEADKALALAEDVKARLDTIQQKFDAHTHNVATTGTAAAQSGTAAPTTSTIGSLDDVASTVVFASE